jgi:hypothetical protein
VDKHSNPNTTVHFDVLLRGWNLELEHGQEIGVYVNGFGALCGQTLESEYNRAF